MGAKPWCYASSLVLYEQAHNAQSGSITSPSFRRLHHLQGDKQTINIYVVDKLFFLVYELRVFIFVYRLVIDAKKTVG